MHPKTFSVGQFNACQLFDLALQHNTDRQLACTHTYWLILRNLPSHPVSYHHGFGYLAYIQHNYRRRVGISIVGLASRSTCR